MIARKMKRRRSVLRKLCGATIGLGASRALFDAAFDRDRPHVEVIRKRVSIPGLPAAFDGVRICQITDVHHGPFLTLEQVHDAVALALEQEPDMFVLTGDLSHKKEWSVAPVWDAMTALEAPLGVWGVMGNHDWWHGIEASREGARHAGVGMLDNRAVPIDRGGERLWVGGVGDLWEDTQDLAGALRDTPTDEAVLLLTHNPDYADQMTDPRVKLMLAGHSHGGQVCAPLLGAMGFVNKKRYTEGLVATEFSQIYISRGIGMAGVPFRLNCPPELTVLELARA